MKKVIYFLMLLFTANYINAQSPIRHISRSHFLYYGADSSVNVMRDSGNYFGTTKDFFDFNKPIKVNGTAIGGGGETLGNPSVSGMLLKSTTAGVRSWGWPDYVRNYNLTDTFSVLRTVPAGMIGNYTRLVDGIYNKIDTLYGEMSIINYNGGGIINHIVTNDQGGNIINVENNDNGIITYIVNNRAYTSYVNDNLKYGIVGHVDRNYEGGIVNDVSINYSGGYVNYVNLNSGICNTVKNAKSTTIPENPIISAQVYYDDIQKWYRDSIGLSHGEIPSATGFDTTVNQSVTLTENVWQKVTNSTNNLWSLSNTASYMTFSADTIKNTYAGKYEYTFSLSVNGKDGATYEYRVMKKTGVTTSVIRKIKITGGGINTERIINCAPLLAAGDRVWLEVRFIGSPTGSPISIFGSYFTAKAVYLSL